MARNKAIDPKVKREIKRKRTGMILSFFIIVLLILLSSSFVLRHIYQGASNVTITESGLLSVYQAATGDYVFSSDDYYNDYDDYDYYDDYNYDYDDTDYTNGNGYTNGTGIYNNQTDAETSTNNGLGNFTNGNGITTN